MCCGFIPNSSLTSFVRRQSNVNATDRLCAALAAIPEVEVGTSRFGSGHNPAWSIAGREFAHLHSASLIDLRLPRSLQAKLRSDLRAHFRTGRSEWLEFEFRSPADIPKIAELAREAAAAVCAKSK